MTTKQQIKEGDIVEYDGMDWILSNPIEDVIDGGTMFQAQALTGEHKGKFTILKPNEQGLEKR